MVTELHVNSLSQPSLSEAERRVYHNHAPPGRVALSYLRHDRTSGSLLRVAVPQAPPSLHLVEHSEHSEKLELSEHSEHSEQSEHSEKSEKSEKSELSEHSEQSDKSEKSDS